MVQADGAGKAILGGRHIALALGECCPSTRQDGPGPSRRQGRGPGFQPLNNPCRPVLATTSQMGGDRGRGPRVDARLVEVYQPGRSLELGEDPGSLLHLASAEGEDGPGEVLGRPHPAQLSSPRGRGLGLLTELIGLLQPAQIEQAKRLLRKGQREREGHELCRFQELVGDGVGRLQSPGAAQDARQEGLPLEEVHRVAVVLGLGDDGRQQPLSLIEALRPQRQLGVQDPRIRPLGHLRDPPWRRLRRFPGHLQPGRVAREVGALRPNGVGQGLDLPTHLGGHQPRPAGQGECSPRSQTEDTQMSLVQEHHRGQLRGLVFRQAHRLLDSDRGFLHPPGPKLGLGQLAEGGQVQRARQVGPAEELLADIPRLLVVTGDP